MSSLAGLTPGQLNVLLLQAMRKHDMLRNQTDARASPVDTKMEAFTLEPRGFSPAAQDDWTLHFGTLHDVTFDAGSLSVSRDDSGYQIVSQSPKLWKRIPASKLRGGDAE